MDWFSINFRVEMKYFMTILTIIVVRIITSAGQEEPSLAEAVLQFLFKDVRNQYLGEPQNERNIHQVIM